MKGLSYISNRQITYSLIYLFTYYLITYLLFQGRVKYEIVTSKSVLCRVRNRVPSSSFVKSPHFLFVKTDFVSLGVLPCRFGIWSGYKSSTSQLSYHKLFRRTRQLKSPTIVGLGQTTQECLSRFYQTVRPETGTETLTRSPDRSPFSLWTEGLSTVDGYLHPLVWLSSTSDILSLMRLGASPSGF